MSSSGKGQSLLKGPTTCRPPGITPPRRRVNQGRVIVEGFIDFDYEITQLTVRACDASGGADLFLRPHRPCAGVGRLRGILAAPGRARRPGALAGDAGAVTANLGGRGLFGVELFVKGDMVWFSEVSPRPHDTGLVTLCSSASPSLSCTPAPSSACRWT
jgi:phosphoribosylglycinamide formyltransferase 2